MSRHKPPKTSPKSAPLIPRAAVPKDELAQILGHFNAGRHPQMEAAARELTAHYPEDGQAWKAWGVALLLLGRDALGALQRASHLMPGDADVAANLGSVLCARGEFDEATKWFRSALKIRPASAQILSNLGDALARKEHWQDAESSCRQALQLQPGLPAAQLNLGNALKGQGRVADAVACYRLALAGNPALPEAHLALGVALKELGQFETAADSLRQALHLRPMHAPTLDQMGVVLRSTGQADAALACLRQATEFQPALAAAHFHLAQLLSDLGRADEAVASYRRAVALRPDWAEPHVNLGAELLTLGGTAEAVIVLQEAVRLRPESAEAHTNLGNALMAQGQFGPALTQLRLAVNRAPNWAVAHSNLAHLLKSVGQPAAALAALQQAQHLDPERIALLSQILFTQNYLPRPRSASDAMPAEATTFGALAKSRVRPGWAAAPQPGLPDKCLRIGLLSGDLRLHPVGYFTESVLVSLSTGARGRVELLAYDNHSGSDELTQRLQAHCSKWTNVARMDDEALATCIRADGIDILIDLAGHTNHNRLPMMAWRPAPLQLSWLGYCGSTGLDEVDAFIADPWIVPDGAEHEFCETVVRLPETFLCFTPPTHELAISPLPALRGNGIRFGCFHQLAKINDEVIAAWARILDALPGSQLILQAQPLQDASVREQITQRFVAQGVGRGRLTLQAAQERASYLAGYSEVDIALDTFPYPGGTTSLEALWMGVPVLTLRGHSALSRQGASIMHNLGMPDWIAHDAEDYVAKAVHHAASLAVLAGIRQSLRAQLLQSPLCNAARFSDNFERCMRDLWRQRCASAEHTTERP